MAAGPAAGRDGWSQVCRGLERPQEDLASHANEYRIGGKERQAALLNTAGTESLLSGRLPAQGVLCIS